MKTELLQMLYMRQFQTEIDISRFIESNNLVIAIPYVRCPTCGEKNYVSTSDYPRVERGGRHYKQYTCSHCYHVHEVSFYELKEDEAREERKETPSLYDIEHWKRLNELFSKRDAGIIPYDEATKLIEKENYDWEYHFDTVHNQPIHPLEYYFIPEVKAEKRSTISRSKYGSIKLGLRDFWKGLSQKASDEWNLALEIQREIEKAGIDLRELYGKTSISQLPERERRIIRQIILKYV